MKKRILFLSIALVSLTAFSFAADAPAISKNVMNEFNRQFSSARDVQWENNANFIRAEFTLNDMVLFAYFNTGGDLIALSRYISPKQLPLETLKSLKNTSAGYWISDLFEISTDAGTSYYATVQNADQVLVLKSEGGNNWQIFQREKKADAE